MFGTARTGCLLCTAWLSGCAAHEKSLPAELPAASAVCAVELQGATFKATVAEAPPLLKSRLALEVDADREFLRNELERQVPIVLAAERDRHVGAYGKVDYTVRRSKLDVSAGDGEIHISTTVGAEIKVCKPLGPFCVSYGSCSPRFFVNVVQPLTSGPIDQLPPPQFALTPSRGCRIAGVDVTPRLSQVAKQQTAGIKARFRRELSKVREHMAEVEGFLRTPLTLTREQCLRMSPEQIWVSKPELDARHVKLAAAVDGQLSLLSDCREAPSESTTAHSASKTELIPQLIDAPAGAPEMRLAVRSALGYDELGRSLAKTLSQAFVDSANRTLRVTKVRVEPFAEQEAGRVAVSLQVRGSVCGDVSFSAEPRLNADEGVVMLESIRLFNASAREQLEPFGLWARLTGKLRVKTAPEPRQAARALDELLSLAQRFLSEPQELELSWGKAEALRPVATQDGLLVDVILKGQLRLSVHEAETP